MLVGEMRDLETIEAALTVSETGHLCFATLHTNSAVQTINRIVDVFPPYQQAQVRAQLSFVLEGVLCQSLIPRANGPGRAMSLEVMVPNPAIRNLIREDKIHQIYSQMQIGQDKFGMQTMNQSLASLYARRLISLEDAMGRSSDPEELKTMIAQGGGAHAGAQGGRRGLAARPEGRGHMPVFTWEGRTRQGTTKKGVMEAVNEAAVMAQLRAQAVTPIAVKPKAQGPARGLPAREAAGSPTKELVMFTRQFATMIDAGLPLVQCLDIQAEQQPNKRFKEILRDVKAEVEQGSTFADALRRHPKPFDDLYANLVQAGEVGGILDTILNRLAVYLEKAEAPEAQGEGRDGLPGDDPGRRHRRRDPAAREGDPGLREDVQGLRRRAARRRRRWS